MCWKIMLGLVLPKDDGFPKTDATSLLASSVSFLPTSWPIGLQGCSGQGLHDFFYEHNLNSKLVGKTFTVYRKFTKPQKLSPSKVLFFKVYILVVMINQMAKPFSPPFH